jgi:hypothetical protein
MIAQQKPKSFFAKYWGWFAGGAAVVVIGLVAILALLYVFVVKGDAKVTNLSLSDESIVYGAHVEARVMVENTGLLAVKYAGTVMVDGKAQQLGEVKLEANKPQTLTLDVSKLAPGEHKINIEEFSQDLKILKPAEFAVKSFELTGDNETVLVGDTITATAKVSNTGEVEGTYTAAFTYDTTLVDSQEVKVGPGAEVTIVSAIKAPQRGDHSISMGDRSQAFTVLSPANLEVTDLKISKSYAKPGEAITVTATFVNSGDIAGAYPLDLKFGGKSAHKEQFNVDPNSTMMFTYKLTPNKAGKYAVTIGNRTATLYVVTITRPANGTLLIKKANSGMGRLTLVNGYKDKDVVVTLVSTANTKAPLLTVYLRAGSKAANIKIKDGNYYVFYSSGTGYDSSSKMFITNPYMGRFESPIDFKTTKKGYTTYYSVWTVSLNVEDGNSSTVAVSDSDFPK